MASPTGPLGPTPAPQNYPAVNYPGTPGVPIPGASAYASADVLAHNAYRNALAQINANRLNTLTQYGYTGHINPRTGVVNHVRVDPNALHGQLQDLLHGQALEDEGAAMASQNRGLLGGLANQAGANLRWQHVGQDVVLGNNLQTLLSGYQTQQQQAMETRNQALWQAKQAAADRAAMEQEQQSIDQLIGAYGNPSAGHAKNKAKRKILGKAGR